MSLKVCTKCGIGYPSTLEYFYKYQRMKNGLHSWCKECFKEDVKKYQEKNKKYYKKYHKEYYREWYKKNKNRISILFKKKYKENIKNYKDKILQRTFGISLEEYNQMLEEQNGVCAICKCEEKTKVQGNIRCLSIDHNHDTGEIRGLLCNRCNKLLGIIEIYKKDPIKWDNYLKKIRCLNESSTRDNKKTNECVRLL